MMMGMLKQSQRIKVLSLVVMAAGLSMGNESCEQAQVKDRTLKMEVELGSLKARSITLPNGERVDFAYVINSLFYRQVILHDHFVIIGAVPSPASIMSQQLAGSTVATATAMATTGNSGGSNTENNDNGNKDTSSDDGSAYLPSALDEKILKSYGFLDGIQKEATAQMQSLAAGLNPQTLAATTAAASNATLPACIYDMPQTRLGGEMISFEATWGVGLGIGYSSNGSALPVGAGGYVDFSQSKLELGLKTEDPLTLEVVDIGDGVAHQSNVKFGVSFNPGVPIGLDFFFNTPLSDVIRTAMTRGLDDIVDSYVNMQSPVKKDWSEAWESRVIYEPTIANNDTHVAFRGGSRAGVQIGDKFTVTNLKYLWEGAECFTRLRDRIPLTTTPIAEVTVVNVGQNIAVAQVKYLMDEGIKPGARVKILSLVQPPSQTTQTTQTVASQAVTPR